MIKMIKLKCGCTVIDDGKFVVGARCFGCRECNAVAELHPFGDKSLDEIEG